MRILFISSKDIHGGAPKAAYRLHRALLTAGIDSVMLVGEKLTDDFTVVHSAKGLGVIIQKIIAKLDAWPLRKYIRKSLFSVNWLPDNIQRHISRINPDIIHLHWIGQGFVNIKSIGQFNQPIVWTMHDMWTFTGGCHYSGGCEKYKKDCGACPQLNSEKSRDITYKILRKKQNSWHQKNMMVVSPSKWISTCAGQSSLLKNCRIKTIPYNIDVTMFKPTEQRLARQILNIPVDRKIILFGAMSATSDERKGFSHLLEAIRHLEKEGETNVTILIYGSSQPKNPIEIKTPVFYVGILQDEITLSLCYSAADVFVAPSTEDNLPLTVMESLSCGTPVVAFNIGGMPDMIEHKVNGYMASPFRTDDLGDGIRWVLSNGNEEMKRRCRLKVVENYHSKIIVEKYLQAYNELLQI